MWVYTTINHPFGNGLYQLSMVMWGLWHCYTHITVDSQTLSMNSFLNYLESPTYLKTCWWSQGGTLYLFYTCRYPLSLWGMVWKIDVNINLLLYNSDYPLVIKHGLLENGPLPSDFPIKTSIHYRGFSIAVFDYQRVLQYSVSLIYPTVI